jgi:hypothetical protein
MRRCGSAFQLNSAYGSGLGHNQSKLIIFYLSRESAMKKITTLLIAALAILTLASCTQEQQNKISRDIQNYTGTNGVLEIYAGDKVVRRFLKIDKMSTALGTDDGKPRAYRYGYGVLDENLNMIADAGEKKVYFEISDYAANYVFFENPR